MLGALIIVFREVIEAGLIVGIVMAATRGVSGRGRWVSIGVIAGVVGAAVVALFAGAISDAFQGSGQELFNAGVLSIAYIIVGAMVIPYIDINPKGNGYFTFVERKFSIITVVRSRVFAASLAAATGSMENAAPSVAARFASAPHSATGSPLSEMNTPNHAPPPGV